jgi:hypothetical protein
MDLNKWNPAQTLEKWGCIKLLKELNQRLATPRRRARPLTTRNITEHHNCIGLEPEQLEPQPCATSAAASRPRSSCWRPAPRPART